MTKEELWDSAIDLARDQNEKYTKEDVKIMYGKLIRNNRLLNKNRKWV